MSRRFLDAGFRVSGTLARNRVSMVRDTLCGVHVLTSDFPTGARFRTVIVDSEGSRIAGH